MEMFAVAQCSSLLPVLFKVAIECLSGLLATHTTALEKARIDDLYAQPALKDVQTALVLLRDLTANVKHASEVDGCKERELIAALLRHGKPITQALMKLLPELGHHVDKYKQLVTMLIKVMQKSTRNFHTFCGLAKKGRDQALLKLVPFIKKGLESLINKAREFVDSNQSHFSKEFTIGILKNKNIRGEEIATQIFQKEAEEEEEEEEEEEGEEEEEDADHEDGQTEANVE